MTIDMILFIIIGIFLVLMFLIVYFKDIETNKKLEKYASSIEEQNRQIYKLNQKLSGEGMGGLAEEVDDKITQKSQAITILVEKHLKQFQQTLELLQTEQQKMKVDLDKQVQNINLINSLIFNERQILSAFKNGRSQEEIANELGIDISEVQFILKTHNL